MTVSVLNKLQNQELNKKIKMVMQANLVAAVAGGLGLAFVGYCVYFDRKRRSAPDFRKKLIEKRRSARAARQTQYSTQVRNKSYL